MFFLSTAADAGESTIGVVGGVVDTTRPPPTCSATAPPASLLASREDTTPIRPPAPDAPPSSDSSPTPSPSPPLVRPRALPLHLQPCYWHHAKTQRRPELETVKLFVIAKSTILGKLIMCSPPRKSLVKGERFIRFEGKPEWTDKRSRDKIRQSDGRRPAVTVPGARRETCAASRPTNRAVWLRRAER
ncbi:hypothetical protein J6590_000423 [Homalodisca vitripennis]|nr:hypothetical protein J6590_000423 [Homalodisca vitripennis]